MNLLLRKKGGLVSKDYELTDKDKVVCSMQFKNWKNASLFIEGKRYYVHANGRGKWIMDENGILVAGSQRQGTSPQLTFMVDFDTRSWILKPCRKGLLLHYDIWEDDRVIGQIANKIG